MPSFKHFQSLQDSKVKGENLKGAKLYCSQSCNIIQEVYGISNEYILLSVLNNHLNYGTEILIEFMYAYI
jgi:hypothetical protein